jgi:hypothetical protein
VTPAPAGSRVMDLACSGSRSRQGLIAARNPALLRQPCAGRRAAIRVCVGICGLAAAVKGSSGIRLIMRRRSLRCRQSRLEILRPCLKAANYRSITVNEFGCEGMSQNSDVGDHVEL